MTHSLASFCLLAVLSVAYLTSVRHVERLRLIVSKRQTSSMVGVFTFAGVVVLPAELLVPLVAIVYAAFWPTAKGANWPAHRHAYNSAAVALACLAASWVLGTLPPWGVLVAIPVFMIINLSFVLAAIVIARQREVLEGFRKPEMHLIALGTQVCGALIGGVMQWHSLLALAGVPVVVALHSEALWKALRGSGAVDANGVCNRDVWLYLAEQAHRRGEWFAVVLVEADAGAAHQSALSVLFSHARSGVAAGPGGPARESDVVGIYSPTHLVLLRHLTTAAASQRMARKVGDDLALLGVSAGIGVSGSKQGSVAGLLAIAAAESALRRTVSASDSDEVR